MSPSFATQIKHNWNKYNYGSMACQSADLNFFKVKKLISNFRKSVPQFFVYWHIDHMCQVSRESQKNCRSCYLNKIKKFCKNCKSKILKKCSTVLCILAHRTCAKFCENQRKTVAVAIWKSLTTHRQQTKPATLQLFSMSHICFVLYPIIMSNCHTIYMFTHF